VSVEQGLQSLTPQAEQSHGALDAPHGRLYVGDPIPAACDAKDLAHVFGKSLDTIYGWQKAGKLRKFELRQRMGTLRWSGKKVQRFLEEERRTER
jgi:hypothetical protein